MESTSFRTQVAKLMAVLTAIAVGVLTLVGFFSRYVTNHYTIGVLDVIYIILGVVLFLTRIQIDPSLNDSGRFLKLLWTLLSVAVFTKVGWQIVAVLVGIATLVPISSIIDEKDLFATLTAQPVGVGPLGGTKFQSDFLFSKGDGYVDICQTYPLQKIAQLDKFNLPSCRQTVPGNLLGYAYLEADAQDGTRMSVRLPLAYVKRLTNVGGELIHHLRKPNGV